MARLSGRPRPARAAAVTFVVLLVGTLAGVQALPSAYAATSIVAVLPRPTSGIAADTVQLVAQKYVVLATANDTMAVAGSAISADPESLGRATAAVLAPGTGNVEVTVTLPDRQRAAVAANTVAARLVSASAQDPLVVVESVAPAAPASARAKPARMVLRVAGLLAALLGAALAYWVVGGGTVRLRTPSAQARPR